MKPSHSRPATRGPTSGPHRHTVIDRKPLPPTVFPAADRLRLKNARLRLIPIDAVCHQLYTFTMTTESPEQMKQNYVSLMGVPLGEVFYELIQDAALLHLKWNEFLALFAASPEQIETFNRAAPGFFYLVQEACWDDLVLHIFRMTDDDRNVLSILHLKRLIQPGIRDPFNDKLTTLTAAAKLAHDLRNNHIGHRNRDVALKVKPVPPSSRDDINRAIAAIDEALHFVDHHFTKRAPTLYEHLDIRGGADSILDIVKRGLKDRDRQYEFIPDRPFR